MEASAPRLLASRAVKRQEKARRIQSILDELVPAPSIPLDHGDPFTLLVAVVLSAQCTDARVNQVAPRLFARASTPRAMAALGEAEIRSIIRPCGLAPAKAKALRGLARQILERHGGEVPRSMEELEALPGVGHKTASVVLCQAFGTPAFPIDTHIHRSAARWGLSDGSSVVRTERDLKRLWPERDWARLHLQIIHFARGWCPALRHASAECPICSWAAPRSQRARTAGSRKAAQQRARKGPQRHKTQERDQPRASRKARKGSRR
jgi:endonuclease III